MPRSLGWLIVLISFGCSGGPDPLDAGADAGADVDAGTALPLPAAPLPIALPDFATCPDGWVREPIGSGGERSACVPWAVDAPECPPGETRIPGRGCVRIGGACPSGEWPDGIGADAIHVRAGEVGGDGSEAAPFGTVFEAVAAASDGDVVAIAAGTYDGPVIVSAAITLWGACAEQVTLRGRVGTTAAVRAEVPGVGLRNLTIEGPGVGLRVAELATVDVHDVLTTRSEGLGWWLLPGAEVTGEDLVFSEVLALADGTFGRALEMSDGAHASLARVRVERCRDASFAVVGAGAALSIVDAVVSDTRAGGSGIGRGFSIERGARLDAERVLVERATEIGLNVAGIDTVVEARDLVIRDTAPNATGELGLGVAVATSARATLRRAVVLRSRRAGVQVAGATLSLEDVAIDDTRAQESDGMFGRAILAGAFAEIDLRRVLATRSVDIGVAIADEAIASGGDLTIDEVREGASTGGFGLAVLLGSSAVFSGVEVERASGIGVLVSGSDTRLDLTDLIVRDSTGDALGGLLGYGMQVAEGAQATVARGLVERARGVGIAVGTEGASLVLTDVTVRETAARRCVTTTCMEGGAGIGVSALEGAVLRVERFDLADNALVGAQVASGASLDLVGGVVRGNPVGVNVQVPGYDLGRLTRDVVYVDNGTNLDSTVLFVPPLGGAP